MIIIRLLMQSILATHISGYVSKIKALKFDVAINLQSGYRFLSHLAPTHDMWRVPRASATRGCGQRTIWTAL